MTRNAFAAGVIATLTASGMPPEAIGHWLDTPRTELRDLSPKLALRLPGSGPKVLELARSDIAQLPVPTTEEVHSGNDHTKHLQPSEEAGDPQHHAPASSPPPGTATC